jgi:hypothetical protein
MSLQVQKSFHVRVHATSLNSHFFAVKLIDQIIHKHPKPDRMHGRFCVIFAQNENGQNHGKQRKMSPVRASASSHEAARLEFNIRDERAFRRGFTRVRRGWNYERSRVPLRSAARRRSLRSGFVPAVSPPALHFSACRTADRSVQMASQFFDMVMDETSLIFVRNTAYFL